MHVRPLGQTKTLTDGFAGSRVNKNFQALAKTTFPECDRITQRLWDATIGTPKPRARDRRNEIRNSEHRPGHHTSTDSLGDGRARRFSRRRNQALDVCVPFWELPDYLNYT